MLVTNTFFPKKKNIQLYQFKNFHISVRETNVNHLFLPTLTLLLKTYAKGLSYAHASLCTDVPSMTVQKIEWVHFHPVGSQCIKILLITNYKKIKTFSTLKNSVHVEPVWFSLDSLTLCAALTTAQWYCARLKQISDALKLFSCERDDFLLFSSNIETSCQQNKKSSDKLEIPCGTSF